jgi:hypothetical protein
MILVHLNPRRSSPARKRRYSIPTPKLHETTVWVVSAILAIAIWAAVIWMCQT